MDYRLPIEGSPLLPRSWSGSEWVVMSDRAELWCWSPFRRHRRVTATTDHRGVSAERWPLRPWARWQWERIAALAYDHPRRGAAQLVVCEYGDRFTKPVIGISWNADTRQRLLALLAPVVAKYGAEVDLRDAPASEWWDLDPRSKRPRSVE